MLAMLAACVAPRTGLAQVTGRESQDTPFGKVTPGRELRFPRDHGSHPEFRVEWWYVTGVLEASAGPLGFQITFFRARPAWFAVPVVGQDSGPVLHYLAHARAHCRSRVARRFA